MKRISTAQYQAGITTFLSKLKYGESWIEVLSRRGGKKGTRYLPPGIFVTMFASMQDPEQYIKEEHLKQGLMRRLMIIYKRPADIDRRLPPIMPERRDVRKLLSCYARELAEKMVILNSKRYFQMKYNEDPTIPIFFFGVQDEVNSYAEAVERGIIKKDKEGEDITNFDLYRLGAPEQLRELAATHSLARFSFSAEEDEPEFLVTPEDVERARTFLERGFARTKEALSKISFKKAPIEVDETPDKVYEVIVEAGRKGITRTEFYRKIYRITEKQLSPALKRLVKEGRVIVLPMRTGKAGRPQMRYYATKFFTDEELENLKNQSMLP